MDPRVVVGNAVALRPITPSDYPLIHAAETGGGLGHRWRLRGRTPSYEEFVAGLFNGVLAQYMICDVAGEPLGYTTVYDASLENGVAFFAISKLSTEDRTTRVLQGGALMLARAFDLFPLRKLYAIVSEYNLADFSSGIGRLLKEEGRMKEHEYLAGRYWDQVHLAIYRKDVEIMIERFGRLVGISRVELGDR